MQPILFCAISHQPKIAFRMQKINRRNWIDSGWKKVFRFRWICINIFGNYPLWTFSSTLQCVDWGITKQQTSRLKSWSFNSMKITIKTLKTYHISRNLCMDIPKHIINNSASQNEYNMPYKRNLYIVFLLQIRNVSALRWKIHPIWHSKQRETCIIHREEWNSTLSQKLKKVKVFFSMVVYFHHWRWRLMWCRKNSCNVQLKWGGSYNLLDKLYANYASGKTFVQGSTSC